MKKSLLALALVLLASLTYADETYSIVATGSTATLSSWLGGLDLFRIQQNADVCTRAKLATNCTQADACVALNVPGGASCTAAQANAADARIFTNTLSGREGLLAIKGLKWMAEEARARKAREEAGYGVLSAWCGTNPNTSALDTMCAALGLSSGCYVCGQR
jgi:hypothetical protein